MTEQISVDGVRVRVSVRAGDPDRPPLLLCNGLGASLEAWEPLRNALGDVPTIAFDAPGVGGSDTPWYPPTFRCLARTVDRLLTALDVGTVDVLGVSWGGALAQELAHRHPDRVRRLVLAATVAGWTAVPGTPAAMWILANPYRRLSRSYFERVGPALYGGEVRADPSLLATEKSLQFIGQVSTRAYAWQLLAGRRWTSLPWLHRLPQPTLVLAGDADPVVRLVNARLLARRIPGAALHVVPNGSHVFLATRAAEVAPLVRDFLVEVRPAPTADARSPGP